MIILLLIHGLRVVDGGRCDIASSVRHTFMIYRYIANSRLYVRSTVVYCWTMILVFDMAAPPDGPHDLCTLVTFTLF